MRLLLGLSRLIDRLNDWIGKIVAWCVLIAVLISAGNAVIRYSLNESSNAWLEWQWYLFSAVFLLCAGYTLLRNEHVRIDVISGQLSPRTRAWIDVIGSLLFLLPMAVIIGWLSWPMVVDSYMRHEISGDAGGLLRWPVKLLMPIGFALLALQGVSELIKRIAYLCGLIPDPTRKRHGPHADPTQSEPV
ncbi:MAG TPA: TRAP transporter small permease subunit [Dongiaceae bacterium]|nr:TRAP transporter small permease subunit [Dongiaceae bacterium]